MRGKMLKNKASNMKPKVMLIQLVSFVERIILFPAYIHVNRTPCCVSSDNRHWISPVSTCFLYHWKRRKLLSALECYQSPSPKLIFLQLAYAHNNCIFESVRMGFLLFSWVTCTHTILSYFSPIITRLTPYLTFLYWGQNWWDIVLSSC